MLLVLVLMDPRFLIVCKLYIHCHVDLGRHSDSLRPGQLGNRIQVGAKFPHLSGLALRPIHPPILWGVRSLSGEQSGQGVALTTHSNLV